ncbi:MAG: hypothetical protein IPJ32_02020 [Sphingobacteriaceae bacterium]|nr:hypothetical protein [Sphingobacteriaceae bacterium]
MLNARTVLSGSASTVVLEAVALGKKVVGINFGRYVPIELDKSNYKEVNSGERLAEVIETFFLNDSKQNEIQEANNIFSHDFTKWKEILI